MEDGAARAGVYLYVYPVSLSLITVGRFAALYHTFCGHDRTQTGSRHAAHDRLLLESDIETDAPRTDHAVSFSQMRDRCVHAAGRMDVMGHGA